MVFANGCGNVVYNRCERMRALKPPSCTGLAILTPVFNGIIRISEPEHSSVFVSKVIIIPTYTHYTHNNNVCTN